jgi:uroporphyrinogen decarboxylase
MIEGSPLDAPLLSVLKGERRDPPPVWLMRQAGRWLPEYRALRAEAGGFLNMVYVPERAVEITLQPVRRFAMDGAILFSDILVVPHALGQELSFVEGEGPRLAPPLAAADLTLLHQCPNRLDPVYETVRRLRAMLPPEVTLIGFAGSPWTVATYMVAGEGERGPARLLAHARPDAFAALIERLVHATIAYLKGQAEAGAQALQLFDSWSGALAADQFDRWVIEPTARIVEALHAVCPGVPVIGFPRGAGDKLARYAVATGVDAIGIDETIDPDWAHGVLPPGLPVQGNVDNLALVAGGAGLERAVARCLEAFRSRPHVFNLGHGCVPQTPIPHVEALLRQVRSFHA